MEEKGQEEKVVKRESRAGPRHKHYTYEEKLRAVKLLQTLMHFLHTTKS